MNIFCIFNEIIISLDLTAHARNLKTIGVLGIHENYHSHVFLNTYVNLWVRVRVHVRVFQRVYIMVHNVYYACTFLTLKLEF